MDENGRTFLANDEALTNAIKEKEQCSEYIIGCWYNCYGTPPCEILVGSCKSLSMCQHLESRYGSYRRKEES